MTQAREQAVEVRGFRIRGAAVTRIETFVDAAFAFALTLLIISFDELPGNFAEFIEALKNIPTFAASFAQIALFWYAHHVWSRRFGLDDLATVLISLLLVFVTLVYVFPLRIVFSGLFSWLSHGWMPYALGAHDAAELGWIFVIYGVGFSAMSATIVLLYAHAYRCRAPLALTRRELFLTRAEMGAWTILCAVGVASILFAWFAPTQWKPAAGMAYGALAIIMPIFGVCSERRLTRVLASGQGEPES